MSSDGGTNYKYLGLLSVGAILVASIIFGYLLGAIADDQFGSGPWGVFVGVVVGSVVGFVSFFRTVSRTQK